MLSLGRIRVNLAIDEDHNRSIKTMRHLPALPGVALQSDWTPAAQGYLAYLLINHSPHAIRQIGDVPNFSIGLDYWQNGKWQPYYDRPKTPQKLKCGNYTIKESYIEPGDWEFIGYNIQNETPLKPGKYRITVAYTTTMDDKCSKELDVFDVSAEFAIDK